MTFSIDSARLQAFDVAFTSACNAGLTTAARLRELNSERGVLMREIERKAQKEIRASDPDFLDRALRGGFADEATVSRIRKLGDDIAAKKDLYARTEAHRQRLNDVVDGVRRLARDRGMA